MNSDRDKTNIIDVLTTTGLTILVAGLAIFTLVNGNQAGLLLGGVAIFLTWSLANTVRFGVRPPNRWERFRAWMNMRPLIIGGLGMALLAALATYGPKNFPVLTEEMKIGLTAGILIWTIVVFYTMYRSQWRRESDSGYKARIRYQEPDD